STFAVRIPTSMGAEHTAPGSPLVEAAAEKGYPSRYQCARFQSAESQPLMSVPRKRFETAEAVPRQRKGTITTLWTSMSFIRMNRAARFTGYSSFSAARYMRSYSSLRQRVEFRPADLFSFWAISHDTNGCMNSCGSGEPLTRLYIWRSAERGARVSELAGSVEK